MARRLPCGVWHAGGVDALAVIAPTSPRAWVNVPLRARRVRHLVASPHPALAEDVEYLWWLEASEPLPRPVVRSCASKAAVDLIFTLDGHFAERAEGNLFTAGERGAYLIGPTSTASEVVSSGRCTVVGARLRPGRGADLLRTSGRELRDRAARLDDLFATEARALAGEGDPAEPAAVVERLEGLLLALRRRAPEPDRRVVEALRLVERSRGGLSVAALARWLGTTTRQLERRFRDRVGLSPKRWCRIVRVDHAMRRIASAGAGVAFAKLAGACGFYDQAHLIREFRELAGDTPAGFARAQAGCE